MSVKNCLKEILASSSIGKTRPPVLNQNLKDNLRGGSSSLQHLKLKSHLDCTDGHQDALIWGYLHSTFGLDKYGSGRQGRRTGRCAAGWAVRDEELSPLLLDSFYNILLII